MYDELVKNLRKVESGEYCAVASTEDFPVMQFVKDAADAIEELQKQLREEKVDNVNLTGWLAEEHAKQCPHYIRNVHDRGDDSLCDKWMCEVKSLPKWIPVTERLPDVGKDVLCFCRANICLVLGRDGNLWREGADRYYMSGFVTHWMPLPQLPKSEEQNDGTTD